MTTDGAAGQTRARRVLGAASTALVVALVTLTLGRVATAFLRDPQVAGTALWLAAAAGILAFIAVRPSRRWAVAGGIVVGITTANLITGLAVGPALASALGNATEVATAALIARRYTGLGSGSGVLRRGRRDVAGLVLALVSGVLVGGCVLAVGLRLSGMPHVLLSSRAYVLSHTAGLLMLAPLLLVLPRTQGSWRIVLGQRRLNLQWALGLTGVAAFTTVIFFGDLGDAFGWALIVPLLAAAALLTPVRALSTLVVACLLTALGTVHGHGPLAGIDDHLTRMMALQGLLAAYCLLTLTVTLVTDARVRAGVRLRNAERLAELAFAQAPTGMMITSLQPGRVGEILAVNAALGELLHRDPDELIGHNVTTLAPDGDAEPATEPYEAMLAGRLNTYSRERTLLRSDGRLLPTDHAISVVRPEDGPPYVITQVTDLRGRIEAEQAMADALEAQMVAVSKLKELNAARVDAAARLAHDLRSPLTCVRAYQELLLTGAAGELTDDQAQMLEIAMRNADRVIGLVDELVSTASLELEKIDVIKLTRMPIGRVLTAALDTVQPVCTRQGQVLVRPASGLDALVAADAVQLERALVNVLANAAKYTPEGGRISVAVEASSDGVAVEVTDSGIGIPPHQISRIGEQFFRADTAQQKGIKGTGLGLAVTRAVLAKHDGELRISSSPGHGSTFTLWLPAMADAAADMALVS